jgi:hypothetical protein
MSHFKEVRKAFVQSRQENSQLAERLARLEGKLEGMSESKKSAAQETASEEEDPEEWVSQNLYAKGPQAIDERVRKVLSEESAKQRDTQDQYNQEALRLSQKYDDFGDLVPDMKRVYNENPELAVIPGGMEKAYKLAKAERVTSEEAKAAKKAAKEKSTALKAAARMPAASTRTGRETKPTPEDEIRKRTFGTQDTQRVFG